MSLMISEAEWRAAKAHTDTWAASLNLPNGWMEITIPPGYPELAAQRASLLDRAIATLEQHTARRVLGNDA